MAKESSFSKWIRTNLSNNFDLIRVETKEEDGIPDLYGYRKKDNLPVFIELKSHTPTKKGTIQLQLAPDQKIRLQWLAKFNMTLVICEISENSVLVIFIGKPMEWNRLLTGAVNIQEALKFDNRNQIISKSELSVFLNGLTNY